MNTELEQRLIVKQWDAFSYLQKVASDWGIPKEKYLQKIDSIGGSIPDDKNEINKFLLTIELDKKSANTEWLKIVDKTMLERFENYKLDKIANINADINASYEHILNYNVSITRYLSKISALCTEKDIIENKRFDISAEFTKILESGFWEFLDADNETIRFKTKNNVIINYDNKITGVSRYVDFGTFKVEFKYTRNSFKVFPYENCLSAYGYYSPYISNEGNICWGESAKKAIELMADRKYSEVFSMLATLLSTYDENTTPYRRLEDFQKEYNKKLPSHAQKEISNECDRCERDEDDCECSRCEVCGNFDDEISSDCTCYWCDHCDEKHENQSDCLAYCSICQDNPCSGNCCTECERTDDDCERCRECGSHGVHEGTCSERQTESEET